MPTNPRMALYGGGAHNSTARAKAALRANLVRALRRLDVQVRVVETHGGHGEMYRRVYGPLGVDDGLVIELDAGKAEGLAAQRPAWCVVQGRCEQVLGEGFWGHLPVTMLDVDPFGSPFQVLAAFFLGSRRFAPVMALAVNDGNRHTAGLGRLWNTQWVCEFAGRYGQAAYEMYKEIAFDTVKWMVGEAGYRIESWTSYYCGAKDRMTHYGGILVLDDTGG